MRSGLREMTAMAALALALTAAAPLAAQERKEDERDIITTDLGDRDRLAASAEAIKTLPIFWAKFDNPAPGTDGYFLKVALHYGRNGLEHFWATPLRRDGDKVTVRLANDPIYVKGVKNGQVMTVKLASVSDWTYSKDGKAYGHFTPRMLARKGTPEQRAEIEALLAPTPLEPT